MGRCEESVHWNKMHSVAFGLFSPVCFMIFFFFFNFQLLVRLLL